MVWKKCTRQMLTSSWLWKVPEKVRAWITRHRIALLIRISALYRQSQIPIDLCCLHSARPSDEFSDTGINKLWCLPTKKKKKRRSKPARQVELSAQGQRCPCDEFSDKVPWNCLLHSLWNIVHCPDDCPTFVHKLHVLRKLFCFFFVFLITHLRFSQHVFSLFFFSPTLCRA